MTNEQSTLLALLSNALFNKPIDQEQDDYNWEKIYQEAKEQAVASLVFHTLDQDHIDCMPPELYETWRKNATFALANNVRISHNHLLVHQWMTENQIPYVILKGVASSRYYPVPEYRALGDVDFLIPRECMQKVDSIMKNHGLKPAENGHGFHVAYTGNRMCMEAHFDVTDVPNGKTGDAIHMYLEDIFQMSSMQMTSGGEMVLPSPFHHGLVLLLHTCRHMMESGIGLRHLCDWAVFENSFTDNEFRNLFEEKLREMGLWRFAQELTKVCILYLGVEDREWVRNDGLDSEPSAISPDKEIHGENEFALTVELMEDILRSGSFGMKDTNRGIESLLISKSGKNDLQSPADVLLQFYRSVNNVVYYYWPFVKKARILLPVGWVYFGGRRIIRGITGKRKPLNVKNMIEGASERRNIYKELHLFETDS